MSSLYFPFMVIPSFIHLYQGAEVAHLEYNEIATYLQNFVKQGQINLRPDFFSFHFSLYQGKAREEILKKVALQKACSKIRNFGRLHHVSTPHQLEIDYELKILLGETGSSYGVVYDGYKLQQLYLSYLPEKERIIHHLHLVFTDQLFATFDPGNRRYHLRVSVYGLPSLISVSGVVEAPAKPMDFYLKRHLGVFSQGIEGGNDGSFLTYDDCRLTEVLKGYVIQALFYFLRGEPFCENKNCRLFNAHTHGELLHAQLYSPYEFCSYHQLMLDWLKDV